MPGQNAQAVGVDRYDRDVADSADDHVSVVRVSFLPFCFSLLLFCIVIHEKKVLSAGVLGCKTSPAYCLPHSSGFQSGEIGEDV